MGVLITCILVLYAVLSVCDSYAAAKGGKRWAKPLLMPVLILFCLLFRQTYGSEYSFLLPLGLICGWLGDVLLLQKGDTFFAGGLAAFLVGHLLYAALFLTRAQVQLSAAVVITAIIYCLDLVIVASKLIPISPGKLKIPVICYMTVILFMSFSACLYMMSRPVFGALSFAGSVSFVISDMILYIGVLKGRDDGALVMGTYTAAQLLIALGVLL